MFLVLATLLNMGNIEFGEGANDSSFVKDKQPLQIAAVSRFPFLVVMGWRSDFCLTALAGNLRGMTMRLYVRKGMRERERQIN